MSNTYFHFKQFKINQDKSSMKVCTDSCLFGAYVAQKIEQKIIQPEKILDIGSGTGLLSLMIAQKSNAQIDAVEIDENSFHQTKQNFAESQWNQRLQAFHADIKNYDSPNKYDLIISNPPFFENDLQSESVYKNIAKHHSGLTLKELIHCIKNLLQPDGYFAMLLPFHRMEAFKKMANENQFYLQEELLVKQTQKHPYFRVILYFGTKPVEIISKSLMIKEEIGNYSSEFTLLLKDYYLNL